MKKFIYLFALLIPMLLSGCSLLEEANKSLEYVNEATEYINTVSNFAEDAPQMIQDAALNAEAKKDLENQLTILLQDIEDFNSIEPPAIAEDIHQQLVTKNEALADEINQVMDSGEVLIDQLENSQIYDTIDEITKLQNQLEELGV